MPKDEWKDVYSSLSKDIEELRKELLTERIKNLPEMVKGMITTARQDMEIRIQEIQQNVKEQKTLVDEKGVELDTRMKELDNILSTIQANEARIVKFVDTYGGELGEVKGDIEKLQKDVRTVEAMFKVKMSDINAKMEKFGSLDSALKNSIQIKREWGKVASKWEKIDLKLSKMLNEFKEIKTTQKVLDNHVDDLDDLFKSIINRFDRVEGKMSEAEKSIAIVNSGAQTINELRAYISRLNELYQKVGSIDGKVSELEQYYKNPDAWLSEKVEKWLDRKVDRIEKDLADLKGVVRKDRDFTRQDFLQTIMVSRLTEISNSDSWENVVIGLRSLEFVISELKRRGFWSPTIKDSVIQSLAGTRDFWEAKRPEVSNILQDGIERIEKE